MDDFIVSVDIKTLDISDFFKVLNENIDYSIDDGVRGAWCVVQIIGPGLHASTFSRPNL